MTHLLKSLLVSSALLLSACGGDSTSSDLNTPQNSEATSAPLVISGRVGEYKFAIPCDHINFDLTASSNAGVDYSYQSATSGSTGIAFQLILPTKSSLFKNKIGKYGTFAMGGFTDTNGASANAMDQFKLGIKIPKGSFETGERFYSLDAEPSNDFYSQLMSVVEEKKTDGKTHMVVTFKYRIPVSHFKAGLAQPNTVVEEGLLRLKIVVADA